MEAIIQTAVHKDSKSDVREKYEDDNLNYLPDIGMRKRNKKDTIKKQRHSPSFSKPGLTRNLCHEQQSSTIYKECQQYSKGF